MASNPASINGCGEAFVRGGFSSERLVRNFLKSPNSATIKHKQSTINFAKQPGLVGRGSCQSPINPNFSLQPYPTRQEGGIEANVSRTLRKRPNAFPRPKGEGRVRGKETHDNPRGVELCRKHFRKLRRFFLLIRGSINHQPSTINNKQSTINSPTPRSGSQLCGATSPTH